MSPDFDAVRSGGNRDVLLNVWLHLPGEMGWMIAELQLHAKPLFDLKHALHVRYKGARLLGALEPSMIEHRGQLTDRAIVRAKAGVVRYLKCNHGTLAGRQGLLQELLQQGDCPLLELSIAGNRDEDRPAELFHCSLHELLITEDKQLLMCSRLRVLDLRRRGLHGSLPEKLGTCTEMTTLQLGYNDIAGPIPRAFKFMTKLTQLAINNCNLSGELPEALGSLVHLQQLSLDGNQLTGQIPESFGKLKNLQHLYLYNNQLEGAIPDSLANCKKLQAVNLADNRLSGVVPPTWLAEATWPDIGKFKLSNNKDMRLDGGRLKELQQSAAGGDEYWKRVLAKSEDYWRSCALKQG